MHSHTVPVWFSQHPGTAERTRRQNTLPFTATLTELKATCTEQSGGQRCRSQTSEMIRYLSCLFSLSLLCKNKLVQVVLWKKIVPIFANHFSLCRNVNTQRGKTEDAFVCGHSSKICFIGGHGVPVGAIRPRMFLLLKGPQSYEYQCHILGKGR